MNFFNTINKEFLDEIKSPCQFNEHEVNTNVTDIDFIVTTVQRTPIVLFHIQIIRLMKKF